MDENVVVAGTLVGAVLEHHGYITQADFLQAFRSFFRDAGAFVYLAAGVGAVVSFAMFGSFRAARYLILGPALFWFMVGPTTETGGVLWQLGGGQPIGESREQGEAAAVAYRQKILQKMNVPGVGQPINVATGFWLFAWPINEFVKEFVDRMLDLEDTEDLTANQKAIALEFIISMIPTDTSHLSRLNHFSSRCGYMLASANAAAALSVRARNATAEQAEGLNEVRQAHLKKMEEYATLGFATEDTVFDDYIRAAHAGTGGSALAKALWDSSTDAPREMITCAQAWALIAEETWHKAGEEEGR
ncbi:MAG: hypothetical protein KDD69_00415, partial [Bdellovibrionales bacterium]|nr:hypothetical protein [Bdellovibrionales bacterium]